VKPRLFLPAILTGLLLWTAYFPLDLGPVSVVALVPWLTLVRSPASRKRRYFAAYVGGLTFFAPALQWLRVADPMMYVSWAALALVCPLFWVAGLFLLRRIDRLGTVPLAVSVPVVWVALEYLRAHAPAGYPFMKAVGLYQLSGFGWYFLGYTQHHVLPLIQAADLAGVYAVTFVVAAVNGLAFEWLTRIKAVRRWLRWEPEPRPGFTGLVPATVGVAVLAAAAVGYGMNRLDHPAFADGPRVAMIQADIPQSAKMGDTDGLIRTYNRLAIEAARGGADLVVWPETCYPPGWLTVSPGLPPAEWPDGLLDAIRRSEASVRFLAAGPPEGTPVPPGFRPWRTNVLLGTNGYEWDGTRKVPTNTALLVNPAGDVTGRYDKMHLVPFGEYVPFRETFPWLSAFTPYKWDYSCRPGAEYTRFPLRTAVNRSFTFGCLICYEDSDPSLARQYAGPDRPVDFLVNISNDGWFNGTEEHEEHLAICRFRAVETRRAVVRAVNMGISGVIDPDGRVVEIPGETWAKSKKVEAVVRAVVPVDSRVTLYARFGDWLPAACWGLIAVGVVAARFRKRAPVAA
jgi:apolipoprotein N-acyltransferase